MTETLLAPARFDPHDALRRFSQNDDAGACASFIGFCRGDGPNGKIEWLELEHYPGFTETQIAAIADAIVTRHSLIDLLAIHRVGRVLPGEAIVLVAARSRHRAAAFSAVEQMMDYLKTDAPFWKKEKRADGAHWIEPTAEDRRRRAAHHS
jgi:molybdopterin synthase catalytic subunit